MSLRVISARALGLVDRGLSVHVPLFERPALLAFLFHSLFDDRHQIGEGIVYPQEGLTKADLRRLVGYFRGHGYEFVSAAQIQGGLAPGGRYVHVTFDDGYANNIAAAELLETMEVPATIFVTTDHVERNRPFWWDVLYRERRRQGSTVAKIEAEMRWLKTQPYYTVDAYVASEFRAAALHPVSDVDRPLTPDELSALARSEWITIGNHTKSHAILTRLDREQVRTQLEDAQTYLEQVTGRRPETVAYPNGDYDAAVLEVARASGFRLGVTVDRRKNRVPSENGDLLALGRHVIAGDQELVQQLRVSRSELQLANVVRRLIRRP